MISDLVRDSSDDYRTDPALAGACKDEIGRLCGDRAAHGGEVQVGAQCFCVRVFF